MRFASRAHPDQVVGFREALFTGLAPDGGLYHPVDPPNLASLISGLGDGQSFHDIAGEICAALLSPDVSAAAARSLAGSAFSFSPTLVPLNDRILLLELFHGPTCAFKDFGAQFLAAAMEGFLREQRARASRSSSPPRATRGARWRTPSMAAGTST